MTDPRASAPNPRPWWMLAAALALAWALECFVVQQLSLVPRFETTPPAVSIAVRAALDVMAALALVVMLGRLLPVALLADTILNGVLLVFHGHFGEPLSIYIAYYQFGEGVEVAGVLPAMIKTAHMVGLAAALAIKLALWWQLRQRPAPRWTRRIQVAMGALLVVFALIGAGKDYIKPLELSENVRAQYYSATAYRGITYGYAVAWASQLVYEPTDRFTEFAEERRQSATDRLTPVEVSLDVPGHVVLAQLESFDAVAVDQDVAGQPVMPFVRGLAARSMRYEVSAMHAGGTCDIDFAMMMGYPPLGLLVPYRFGAYRYDEALPRRARRWGWRSEVLHGNAGAFFARRYAYRQMGFDELLFGEELTRDHGVSRAASGWGIADEDVLDVAARRLERAPSRTLELVITMTTHTPFDYLRADQKELYAQPRDWRERYANNMRYLDRCLERFVGRLAPDTLVVLYSDSALIQTEDLELRGDQQSTPRFAVIIHQVGRDLSTGQRTRRGLAMGGQLGFVDLIRYVHGQLEANARPAGTGSGS